ncbi:uncharacterized protein TRIADDRAFT_60991 [Trichoplax adhaerens]|uniref:Guided entry of tail-anchored proteins factor 1 n=1 Tax=Trichoplax adhaerens TaxID=10228 RepID=B3S9Q5_TRIAD|nr:hypothetical protein TRIADDRAFT_60991 [Trichoplax adhaerens]EDV20516.1 hypothetical protein TRIADDRAFT_60991 [Trichoplax adhaerens]|eukprot:XP_002116942.1 hypothetical protein TRIADDRAFT_60991 [Trichoplax adhaerens]
MASIHLSSSALNLISIFLYIFFVRFAYLVIHKLLLTTLCKKHQEEELNQQIQVLRQEMRNISMVDNFAPYSKLNRKVAKLSSDYENLSTKRKKMEFKINAACFLVYAVITIGVHARLTFIWYKHPLLLMPGDWMVPINILISVPTGKAGAIGICSWLAICQSVVYHFPFKLIL